MISASFSVPKPNDLTLRTVTQYATLAPLYDALLGDSFFPYLRRTFEWLVRRYGIRFASMADMACGTGTFIRYLCERGVPVICGVDRSPEMLRIAIAKNQGNSVRFLLQDFTTLHLPQAVDLITCNFDSLNYLMDKNALLQTLQRFGANLNPGGHVIFDMITNRPLWQGTEPFLERVIGPGIGFLRVMRWDPYRGTQTSMISVSRHGRSHREIHRHRAYPIAVVVSLLTKARFALLGAHDFQTLGPATIRTSRVVYVTRRM